MAKFPINPDSSFREDLAMGIVIEAQPGYDGDTNGWRYADAINGKVYRWIPSEAKPWPEELEWSLLDVNQLADVSELTLDLADQDWAWVLEGYDFGIADIILNWARVQGYDDSQIYLEDGPQLQQWCLADDVRSDALTWAADDDQYKDELARATKEATDRVVAEVQERIKDFIEVTVEAFYEEPFNNMPQVA